MHNFLNPTTNPSGRLSEEKEIKLGLSCAKLRVRLRLRLNLVSFLPEAKS